MAEAPDREFAVFQRGEVRELILSLFRNALREQTNPDTDATFTEEEIAVATAKGTKRWVEADADDIVAFMDQQRALWLADQVRVDRAGSSWLINYHGRMWGEEPLEGTGGSGEVTATATAGTVYIGSTTIPDAAAHYATDSSGQRYQVLYNVTTGAGGTATLDMAGIDTGTDTNLVTADVLTWANPPAGSQPTAVVATDFTGGTDTETDTEFARRLAARIRHKPASGNVAHFRAWARESTNAVEDAFVYACAMRAGSVLVCIVGKRAGTSGPNARILAATSALSTVESYIVPPASAVVPAQAHVLVVVPVAESSNTLLRLAMAKGRTSGWTDLSPWPTYSSAVSEVTVVTTQTSFRIHSDTALPTGVTAPSLMVWNDDDSRFEKLNVTSVSSFGGGQYTVTLSQAASFTIAAGDYVSPDTERRVEIAEAVEDYFDARGPGEIIDIVSNTDTRRHRAFRFPEPYEEWPQTVGSGIATYLHDALGVALSSADMISMSVLTPTVPTYVETGPSLITLGKLAVYAQT
jgi:uncharacterized phage protein gp47/JayE